MAAENIKEVYITINGTKINASYDEAQDLWTVTGTAPSESSWNQDGHTYKIVITAVDYAGNTATMDYTNETWGDQLQLRVLETTAPVTTIIAPTEGSAFGESTVEIKIKFTDAGDSGINRSEAVLKVNDTPIPNEELAWAEEEGDIATYQAKSLGDGINKVEAMVKDNDGNESAPHIVNFIVSTSGPIINVVAPPERVVTNANTILFGGSITTIAEIVTVQRATIAGEDAELDEDGVFSKYVTLVEGENVIEIVATDSLGKTSRLSRTVICDTKAPIISDVTAESTVVNASGQFKLSFKVVDIGGISE